MTEEQQVSSATDSGKPTVFISFAGEVSEKIATILHEWIPPVLQFVKPWLSGRSIPKGTFWQKPLTETLAECNCGIFCVTPENVDSKWLHFELGAITKATFNSRAWILLFGVPKHNLTQPLSLFQYTEYKEDDIKTLFHEINKHCEPMGVDPSTLDKILERWLPDLQKNLRPLNEQAQELNKSVSDQSPKTVEGDMMAKRQTEILATMRDLKESVSSDVQMIVNAVKEPSSAAAGSGPPSIGRALLRSAVLRQHDLARKSRVERRIASLIEYLKNARSAHELSEIGSLLRDARARYMTFAYQSNMELNAEVLDQINEVLDHIPPESSDG